ncbi:hypothetical protein OP10G_2048 [Fimbriimonas ginsengisoli Gsoil 348]|uniref:Uncharacterized protein n=1 Tax=Fimbriimonas ginsengisoli Gsoil 348 TaxID=661478 RepID=A0A068NPP4_FIMGI|nr:hypothetical protein OP10G_2048 [Fimbriimonas ginsengisoli Gsoil 348]
MNPKISLALYVYSFVALGYVIVAMSIEKIRYGRAKKS